MQQSEDSADVYSIAVTFMACREFYLVEVNILHPYILHHGRLLVNVGGDDTEGGAALSEHTFTHRNKPVGLITLIDKEKWYHVEAKLAVPALKDQYVQ